MSSSPESHGVQATPSAAPGHDVQTVPTAAEQEATHALGHPPAEEGPHFSEQEWKEFQDDDVHAAGAIILLMAGIFTIGLMLYTTIAAIVGA